MKTKIFIPAVLLILLSSFTIHAPKGFKYYKTFNISRESAELGINHIEHRIMMTKNMTYSIVLEENDCDVIIQMHDEKGRLILTNYDKEKDACLNSIIFKCNSTKYYTLSLDPKRSRAHGICKVGFKN